MPSKSKAPSKGTDIVVAAQLEQHDVVVLDEQTLEQNVLRYRAMQSTLDKLMPDQIQQTGTQPDGTPKLFRKKGYWRAIAQGFGLNVERLEERRIKVGEEFGYLCVYRATDPRTERFADGDGACFASEKADRRGNIGGTEHNVRGHANTRGFNRAVSNLVAFGEVSADELENGVEPQAPISSKRRVELPTVDDRQQQKKPNGSRSGELSIESDDNEYVNEVLAKRVLDNGTTVYHIWTTARKYTCLLPDVVAVAEQAKASNSPVKVKYEEKETGNKISYNAMKGIEILDEPVASKVENNATNETQEFDPSMASGAPSEDEIPF
jgi:hypothetical protein